MTFYVMLNAGFYTANNIAYSALTALITKNENERVQIGSLRFVFAFTTSTIIQAVTFGLVEHFGNDAAAWRIVALIYVIIGIISNTVSVLSMKELPEDEIEAKKAVDAPEEKYTLREAVGLLVKNKFYLLMEAEAITAFRSPCRGHIPREAMAVKANIMGTLPM